MQIEISSEGFEDFIKLVPENQIDINKLLELGKSPYEMIVMGGYIDGSIGISCKRKIIND